MEELEEEEEAKGGEGEEEVGWPRALRRPESQARSILVPLLFVSFGSIIYCDHTTQHNTTQHNTTRQNTAQHSTLSSVINSVLHT